MTLVSDTYRVNIIHRLCVVQSRDSILTLGFKNIDHRVFANDRDMLFGLLDSQLALCYVGDAGLS